MADVQIDTTARIERIRMEDQAASPASPDAGYSQIYTLTTGSMYGAYVESAGGQFEPLISPYPFEGKLTIDTSFPTGNPTGTSAAGTLSYIPYVGNRITLFDANGSPEIHSFSIVNWTVSTTGTASYDAFMYDNAGTLTIEVVGWTSPTTRATEIVRYKGVLVKSGDITRSYLGTFYSETANEIEDTEKQRFLWNYYNRVLQRLFLVEDTAHAYGVAGWRSWNNDPAVRFEVIVGVAEDAFLASVESVLKSGLAGNQVLVSLGFDVTNGAISGCVMGNDLTENIRVGASVPHDITLGYHFYQAVEFGTGAGVTAFNNVRMKGGILG